jgi:type II secretory pathway component PulC
VKAAPRKQEPPPVKKPEPPPIVKAPPAFPKMKMQGVIFREAQPFVILNGESYTVGDHVGEVVVRAIDRTSVLLELEGQVKVLTIN